MAFIFGYPQEDRRRFIEKHYKDYSKQPICFEAVDAGATIALGKYGTNLASATFQTSTDGNTWSDYTYDTYITLANAGDKVYFRAKDDNTGIVRYYDNYLQFKTNASSKLVNVSGNIMSLLAPEFKDLKDLSTIRAGQPGSYEFYFLFRNCYNISECNMLNLPATTLADSCYAHMFAVCFSLTQAPDLPATTLADSCYAHMFSGCSSLTQAPALPATTLADDCYSYMFSGCTSLTQAPELPATTLAIACCYYMFYYCTSLTQAPDLPATEYAFNAYSYMFSNTLVTDLSLPNATIDQVLSWQTQNSNSEQLLTNYQVTIHCKDGSRTVQFQYISCFLKGTKITLADETKKQIEDITYDDNLLVWDFDEGKKSESSICWLTIPGLKNDHYYKLTFSDGTVLKTTGRNSNHKVYNVDERFFKGVDKTEVGDRIMSENGIVTVTNKEYIEEEVEYYNLITTHKINCYAEGILTSDRYGNMYPVGDDMKYVKNDRPVRPYSEFEAVGIARHWYDELRLGELVDSVEDVKTYIIKLESQMRSRDVNEN